MDTKFDRMAYAVVLENVGRRARALRLGQNLTQAALSEKAGVGVETVRRFERTGKATLDVTLRIATALGAEDGFAKLFEGPGYATLDEALDAKKPTRIRARKKKPTGSKR